MTIILSQELGGDLDEHGFVLRGGPGDGLLDVYPGEADDVHGAQQWASGVLAAKGITVDRWTQDGEGRAAEWPFWRPTFGSRPAAPGEVCTCGRPAREVLFNEKFGETGYCGLSDGGREGPCPSCHRVERHVGRCPEYRVRPGATLAIDSATERRTTAVIYTALIDVSGWAELTEVDAYAGYRGLTREQAIKELVCKGLDYR